MRVCLLVLLTVLVIVGAGCKTTQSGSTAVTPGSADYLACAAINNMVEGAYATSGSSAQEVAGQDVISRSEVANNPTLVSDAHQLQSDANAGNQSAVNTDLANMAQTCSSMGIGPTTSGT